MMSWKKKRFFQKLFDICGTVTKYELRTPRELGAIRNLEKTFFSTKKNVFCEQFDIDL